MLYVKCFFLFLFFNINFTSYQNKKITVIGKAQDAKRSAVLISVSGDVYYLDELPSWEKKYLGKRVKVTGELTIEVNKRNITVQQVEGRVYIIKKAKWQLLH